MAYGRRGGRGRGSGRGRGNREERGERGERGRGNSAEDGMAGQVERNGCGSNKGGYAMQHYNDIPRQNADFEFYYKTLGVVAEEEWDLFVQTLGLSLPTTFRLTGNRLESQALMEKLLNGTLFSSLGLTVAHQHHNFVACNHCQVHVSLAVDCKFSSRTENDSTIDSPSSHNLNRSESTDKLLNQKPQLADEQNIMGKNSSLSDSINNNIKDSIKPTVSLDDSIATVPFNLNLGIKPLPWYYPLGMAWHLDGGRKEVRTMDFYRAFHKWLVAATENGDVSRQEAVSMVPPLFMNVKHDHLVLDMCAAPGSKTAQLIEQLYVDYYSQFGRSGREGPSGLVIANDADQQRSYMLYHQVKRILSPNLMVTNNDGTCFPRINLLNKDGLVEKGLFDRILADVPCSGDGTLRKNAQMWKTWTPNHAYGLHPLQVRLLERAVQLLKVGGRVVYSTCSLNVVENEAVIAHVLTKHQSSLQLVDVSDQLIELKRRPGRHSWPIITRDRNIYHSFDEVPEELRKKYPRSLFSTDHYKLLNLDRTMCIYPHLQNTGGFFVAVIEKNAELEYSFSVGDEVASKGKDAGVQCSEEQLNSGSGCSSDAAVADLDHDVALTDAQSNDQCESLIESNQDNSTLRVDRQESDCIDPITLDRVVCADNQLVDGDAVADGDGDADADDMNFSSSNGRVDKGLLLNNAKKVKVSIKDRIASKAEDQFRRLDSESSSILQNIFEWYGIDGQLFSSSHGFLVRTDRDMVRTICIVSKCGKAVFDVTVSFYQKECEAAMFNSSLKIVNAGVRAFELYESNRPVPVACPYRVLAESVEVLLPYMTRRVLPIVAVEVRQLLETQDSVNLPEAVKQLGQGGAVLTCGPVSIPVWISERGVKAFIAKENRPAILQLLKDLPLVVE